MKPQFAHRRGQSMVEFALVMPILLLLILGGIDGLQIYLAQYSASQAARVAAHQAALVGGYDASVAEIARTAIDGGIGTSAEHLTVRGGCGIAPYTAPCRRYDAITVEVVYEDAVFAPFGPFGHFRVERRAVRAAEQDGGPAAAPPSDQQAIDGAMPGAHNILGK